MSKTEISSEDGSLDDNYDLIEHDGTKRIIHDTPQLKIKTDSQCKEILKSFRLFSDLSDHEKELLERCINAASAEDNEETNYGPEEIVFLLSLCQRHPDQVDKITACSHYLLEVIDFEGEMKGDSNMIAFSAYSSLGDILEKSANFNVRDGIPDDSDSSDDV